MARAGVETRESDSGSTTAPRSIPLTSLAAVSWLSPAAFPMGIICDVTRPDERHPDEGRRTERVCPGAAEVACERSGIAAAEVNDPAFWLGNPRTSNCHDLNSRRIPETPFENRRRQGLKQHGYV